jgi:hypothetical protein
MKSQEKAREELDLALAIRQECLTRPPVKNRWKVWTDTLILDLYGILASTTRMDQRHIIELAFPPILGAIRTSFPILPQQMKGFEGVGMKWKRCVERILAARKRHHPAQIHHRGDVLELLKAEAISEWNWTFGEME